MVERPKDNTRRRRNRNEKYGGSKMSLKNSSAKKNIPGRSGQKILPSEVQQHSTKL